MGSRGSSAVLLLLFLCRRTAASSPRDVSLKEWLHFSHEHYQLTDNPNKFSSEIFARSPTTPNPLQSQPWRVSYRQSRLATHSSLHRLHPQWPFCWNSFREQVYGEDERTSYASVSRGQVRGFASME